MPIAPTTKSTRLRRNLRSRLLTANLVALLLVGCGAALALYDGAVAWRLLGVSLSSLGLACIAAPVRIRSSGVFAIGWGRVALTIHLRDIRHTRVDRRDFGRGMGRLQYIAYRPTQSSTDKVLPGSVGLTPLMLDHWMAELASRT